jgi:hypothetical protein
VLRVTKAASAASRRLARRPSPTAALDRPVLGAYDGGGKLLPGSPMATLLNRVPRLGTDPATAPAALAGAVRAHRPGSVHALTGTAFAEHGRGLERLREELHALLGLAPPATPAVPRPLPDPTPPPVTPAAFAVRIRRDERGLIHVTRHPAHLTPPPPVHHLAAEVGTANTRYAQGAALLYRRADRPDTAPGGTIMRTADAWTDRTLAAHPGGRRTAAVIISATHCLLRTRTSPLLSARIEPCSTPDGLLYADPAPVLSAVHAALLTTGNTPAPTTLTCTIGNHAVASMPFSCSSAVSLPSRACTSSRSTKCAGSGGI